MGNHEGQQDLFETEAARSLLDQLLTDSRLYSQSKVIAPGHIKL